MIKKMLIYTRKGIKFTILSVIALFLIIGIVVFLYKPTYAVFLENNQVGYTEDKSKLQKRISDYIEKGDGTNENLAFVQLKENPKYELCLLKKNIVPNDDEIFEKVKENEQPYYRYYAVCDNGVEKTYVNKFNEAEEVVSKLKEKKSKNGDKLTIVEKYETEMKDRVAPDAAVSSMFVEPEKPVVVASTRSKSRGYVNTSQNTSSGKANLGISLIRPTNGIITSPFGRRHSSFHTGLDIANSLGTPIKAAASGTVTYSGWKGSYGNLVVVSHGNGVQTYYAHCSRLNVSAGQKVSQGQNIAAMGSTGNSTGPHLHLEIRVNGTCYNPQNYLY